VPSTWSSATLATFGIHIIVNFWFSYISLFFFISISRLFLTINFRSSSFLTTPPKSLSWILQPQSSGETLPPPPSKRQIAFRCGIRVDVNINKNRKKSWAMLFREHMAPCS
jgi:hypothetical protein